MPMLNVDQAAERLGTSPRFIRRLIAERRIAFAKLGKHVRIDTADLDAFVAAGRVAPAVPAAIPATPTPRQLRNACCALPPVSPEALPLGAATCEVACSWHADGACCRPGEERSCHIRAIVSGE